MPVCFTFDVEPHDRIEAAAGLACPAEVRRAYAQSMEACTRWLLDTLAEFDARATFFVVGQVAVTHSRLVRDMAEAGHEVACHSWDHRRVHHFTPDTFRLDVRRAKHTLEQAAGQPVVGYRAPTFSIGRETAWAIDVLAEEGFRYDSSVFPVRHDRYGVPDAPRFPFHVRGQDHSLLELPPTTLGLGGFNLPAAGGGYFRLFPPMIMRAAVRQAERDPGGVPVLYFHPWEFDPDQPRLPLGRAGRFRTYVGIKRSRSRLRDLLVRYESRPMIDAAEDLGLRVLPTFRLGEPVEVAARAAA
ncbi:MAG TPA: XrtA system polysaccharide deacetylase [Gemmataceae bacterium]|nr:XrtA system polysaccharide deacetylase [Gemmataceae bacterium]